jgi:hypothetical protein
VVSLSATVDNFFGRRSCRKYLNKRVPKVLLNKLIEAGRSAPSVSIYSYFFFLCIKFIIIVTYIFEKFNLNYFFFFKRVQIPNPGNFMWFQIQK